MRKAQAAAEGRQLKTDPIIVDHYVGLVKGGAMTEKELKQLPAQVFKDVTDSMALQGMRFVKPLTPAGQRAMAEVTPIAGQMEQLIKRLEQPSPKTGKALKDENMPWDLMVARFAYQYGYDPSEMADLGSQIANLELSKITGGMPYATKSRSFQYIKQIQTHLPNTWVDSPKLLYGKLKTSLENMNRIKDAIRTYEVEGASADGTPLPVNTNKDPLGIRK